MNIVEQILTARGIDKESFNDFLNPDYSKKHDPFLLPDMEKAVERISGSLKNQEKITIYGDYDIDGITATALLIEALGKFGFKNVDYYLPNRFTDGYGMNKNAIEKISANGTNLIITVDCGSLNHNEIDFANSLGVDVIVTDHHNISETKPNAVAVINPKYQLAENQEDYKNFILKNKNKNLYPFLDLCGVGVAFKLVQALQTRLKGLPEGQEKWLLDLVALGTVCDSVSLIDENRANVYWGLEVMKKQHRPGLKALLSVSGTKSDKIDSRTLGFVLGPRLNAAGRLKTADEALDLILSNNNKDAVKRADYLDKLNASRRVEQDEITAKAKKIAEDYQDNSVLVLSDKNWNHGIIGIVASKIMEQYKKPTFIISENEDNAVGSARSFGDFSVADAIHYAHDYIIRGGGHKVAAGVTLDVNKIKNFRQAVNEYYDSLNLLNQESLLFPQADLEIELTDINLNIARELIKLEPFGAANSEPIFYSKNVMVEQLRAMGKTGQHVKLTVSHGSSSSLELISFNAPAEFFVPENSTIDVWYKIEINEWNGRQKIIGKLVNLTTR